MPNLAEQGGWPAVIGPLLDRMDLTPEQARAAMAEILAGNATPAQVAGFIVGLRIKGETVDELTALLGAMLDAAEIVHLPAELGDRVVDIVGTGGDRHHSINVSTLASLVVAGAGVPVCKHGNRAASSSCGSADLFEALGVVLDQTPAGIASCLSQAGVAFCFAPRFHPALRHAGPTRRELGVPTAFNILGPMANPARARRYVVGVSDPTVAPKMLGVLANHGAVRALVVRGDDGLDELSTTTPSTVHELDHGEVRSWRLEPEVLGLAHAELADLRGGDPSVNAGIARKVLGGEPGPHRDVVVLNAGAGLWVGGAVESMAEGVALAGTAIDDGRAAAALERLVLASADAVSA
jgi:anthranilate phosphoribosyltransferase